MLRTKEKNMAMIAVSAAILVVTNLVVWLAAKEGVMAPLGNSVLWGGFVALNIVSILWAIVLLGLQPMVVALSYLAGGFLAFKGVEGMTGVSVAEVTTAGATYGAFGAMAVGNLTTRVRLAFYNRKQVPFIFIIAGLLVLDAVLNSGVSGAGGRVILNAVVFPFVLAGVIFGLIWTVLNHFGIGYKPRKTAVLEKSASIADEESRQVEAVKQSRKIPESPVVLKFQAPEHVEELEEIPDAVSEPVVEHEIPQVSLERETVAPVATVETEEEFFPLEIDNSDEFMLPAEDIELQSEAGEEVDETDDPFSLPSFDSSLYASGVVDELQGGIMIEEPLKEVSMEDDEEAAPTVDAVVSVEEEEKTPEPSPPEPPAEPDKKNASGDWLSGHLDLLNKLK